MACESMRSQRLSEARATASRCAASSNCTAQHVCAKRIGSVATLVLDDLGSFVLADAREQIAVSASEPERSDSIKCRRHPLLNANAVSVSEAWRERSDSRLVQSLGLY